MEAAKPRARSGGRKKQGNDPVPVDQVVASAAAVTEVENTGAQETPSLPDVLPADKARSRGRGGRGRGAAKTHDPEANPATPAEKPATEKPQRGRGNRGRGRAKPEMPEAMATPEFTVDEFGEELPVPTWRPRSKPASTQRTAPQPPSEGQAPEEPQLAPRKSRRGRGRREQAEPVELELPPEVQEELGTVTFRPREKAPAKKDREEQPRETRTRERKPREPRAAEPPEVVSQPEKEKPQLLPPPKPAIAIPEDAPQIVMRDGMPTLVRNHRVYPPIMFFGSSLDERRAKTVLEELRIAGEAGVHLHSHLVELEVDPDSVDTSVGFAAYLLARSVEIDPESQIIFRVVFQAGRGWQNKYPNAKYQTADGLHAEPSVCDDQFWGDARACLATFIKKLRLLDLRDHILGVHLERGEWFFAQGWGYDTSNAAKSKFREWARVRYQDDEVTLRASWFDGQARFDSLHVPPYQPEGSEGDRFVRSSRKQRKYVDYHLFLSDATVQRIGDLAYAAKEASDGYFLVGASYGYTFEWSHPASGHLSLGKLLRTPEIDFIAGPPSYRNREPGGTAAFPCPIDSFAINGKLYISEEDFKTSLSGGQEPDDFNPIIKTPQALESVHWRGAGAAVSHGSGVSWMDLWGNGWLKTTTIWDRAQKIQETLVQRMSCPLESPDVCVFIDERALAYLVDPNAFTLLVQNVRESVLRSGLSAGFYLLSDLAHRETFPESKLYIFLNAWDIRPDLRAAIKSRLQRDNKVLFWLYAAGLFDSGRESLERAREVTGIALKPQPFYSKSGTTILNRRHPLCEAFPDRSLVGNTKLEPSYFAIPEDATILGEYSQTGLPSFLIKEFTGEDPSLNWKSVFLGEPLVNPALMRALGQMAGAHVWNFTEDVVHVRSPFHTIHCTGAGPRAVALPHKWSAYNLLTRQWVATDSTHLRFTATDGSTHVFLVGLKEELEGFLSVDPASLLHMEELPPKTHEGHRSDAAFDVPIMKLDQWIDEGEPDEVADEWFLRPHQVIEQPDGESEKVGRRRRRRGRRGDREGTEEPTMTRHEYAEEGFEDLGMNVVFRKRD